MVHGLTMLRGLGAALVVLFHVYYSPGDRSGFFIDLLHRGFIGVDLFFVLSGFVLAHVYARDILTAGAFSYGDYVRNRFARIYPLHLVVTLFLVVLALTIPEAIAKAGLRAIWHDLPLHLLMLQVWAIFGISSWNFPDWTISAEFVAYLCLPWIIRGFFRLTPQQGLMIALAVHAVVLAATSGIGNGYYYLSYGYGLLRLFPEFLLGIAVYRMVPAGGDADARRSRLILLGLLLLLAAMLGFAGGWIILSPVLGAIVFFAATSEFRLEEGRHVRAAVYLGRISYATYLVHMPVVMVIRAYLGLSSVDPLTTPQAMAIVAAIYLASVALHHLVEEPARKALRAGRNSKGRQENENSRSG
ncbi:acyltransferase family protein [Algicella marina]|uniref:Acyltransferase family protein n=1 Tax=Algicella marina TaxID=2683284 RepID=A0A6P1SZN8_9RHOB|nr:acyltransferase [Algicella marina]QHQ34499.1 acyltransferase family protein [Algicella marina]